MFLIKSLFITICILYDLIDKVNPLTLTTSQLISWYPNYLNETSLYIGSKQIDTLANDVFFKLNRLEILDLNNNALISLTNKTSRSYFNDLFNLKYLYLEHNRLEFVDQTTFFGLNNLIHLYLHNNRLVHLNERLFASLINLEYLWLDNNEIGELSVKVFNGLDKLKWLQLSYNNITFIL